MKQKRTLQLMLCTGLVAALGGAHPLFAQCGDGLCAGAWDPDMPSECAHISDFTLIWNTKLGLDTIRNDCMTAIDPDTGQPKEYATASVAASAAFLSDVFSCGRPFCAAGQENFLCESLLRYNFDARGGSGSPDVFRLAHSELLPVCDCPPFLAISDSSAFAGLGVVSISSDSMLGIHGTSYASANYGCFYNSGSSFAVAPAKASGSLSQILAPMSEPCSYTTTIYIELETFLQIVGGCDDDGSDSPHGFSELTAESVDSDTFAFATLEGPVEDDDPTPEISTDALSVHAYSIELSWTNPNGETEREWHRGVFAENPRTGEVTRTGAFEAAAFDRSTWTSGRAETNVVFPSNGRENLAVSATVDSFSQFGDLDSDGKLCMAERVAILEMVAGGATVTSATYDAKADFNLDGMIDGTDLDLFDAAVLEFCDLGADEDFCDVDCNENGAPDICDIAYGVSTDDDASGTLDECEGCDCPGDIKPDGKINQDDLYGFSDCYSNPNNPDYNCECAEMNGDGVLDLSDAFLIDLRLVCKQHYCSEPFEDCNGNNVSDACEISQEYAQDNNKNGIPDECEVCDCMGDIKVDGSVNADDVKVITDCFEEPELSPYACECADLNGDGDINVKDQQLVDSIVKCDIGDCSGEVTDCNHNNVDDTCDIKVSNSKDTNKNGVPDECE